MKNQLLHWRDCSPLRLPILESAIRERYLLWFLSVSLKLVEFHRDRIPSHLSMRIGLYHNHNANVAIVLGALACY